jgi:hypothetical protein
MRSRPLRLTQTTVKLAVIFLLSASHISALPSDAPWGNAWTDSAGVVASVFMPIRSFFSCTVDTQMYDSIDACSLACKAG